MTRTIRIGISTCPNDTFAFHALLEGRIETPGLAWDFDLLDVEQLNEGLFRGEFDVAKASFHAPLHLADRYGVFASGSALGFGNGPLLLASKEFAMRWLDATGFKKTERTKKKDLTSEKLLRRMDTGQHLLTFIFRTNGFGPPIEGRILCPGRFTTATLLFRTTFPNSNEPKQVVFSEIMPALQEGRADVGVCIHEGRFTYQEQGLVCIADLGMLWHQRTKMPLPLGGILGRLDLPPDVLSDVQSGIRRSIEYGHAHRDETLPTMRRHAQELDVDVIWAHVDLYVNDATLDLGEEGEQALAAMRQRALDAGVVPADRPPLKILR